MGQGISLVSHSSLPDRLPQATRSQKGLNWPYDAKVIGYHTGLMQVRGVPDGRVLQEGQLPGAVTALAPHQ